MSNVSSIRLGSYRYSEPLVDLLTIIGNKITAETLNKLKFLLCGHLDKEVLHYAETGSELLLILHERGLVTNGRLAFLRKLLKDINCFSLLSYLDGYKDKNRTGVRAGE